MAHYTISDIVPIPSGGTAYSNSHKALATDASSGMVWQVVLKFPRLTTPQELPIYTEGIRQTARSQSALMHPNVNPIVKLVALPDRPLAFVHNLKANGDILLYMSSTQCNVWQLIKEVARGLAYIHSNNIVHGNVHPNNILVDNDGHACLTDIGIHSFLWGLTRPGAIPDTFTHKPAEEFSGEENALRPPTKEMDVYAFGSTVYHVLTGRAPYQLSRYPARELQHIVDYGHISLSRPSQIDTWVWGLIQGCWARDPHHRPSMAQVVFALEQHNFN